MSLQYIEECDMVRTVSSVTVDGQKQGSTHRGLYEEQSRPQRHKTARPRVFVVPSTVAEAHFRTRTTQP